MLCTDSMPPKATGAGYPTFYYEDIKQNKYDLLFEIWDVMIDAANGSTYFDDQTVLDAGTSGVFGEIGWYEG